MTCARHKTIHRESGLVRQTFVEIVGRRVAVGGGREHHSKGLELARESVLTDFGAGGSIRELQLAGACQALTDELRRQRRRECERRSLCPTPTFYPLCHVSHV
jgi:hypothetical protein